MAILAVDIGGSAVKYGIWEDEKLIETDQFQTPLLSQNFFDQIKTILNAFQKKYDIEGIGLSCPGKTNEETGQVSGWSYVPFLNFGAFQKKFSDAMDGVPVSMMNDANCAGLAEMHYGVGKGQKNPLFLIIGSGIGMAFVKDGEIVVDTETELTQFDKNIALDAQVLFGMQVSPVQMGKIVSLHKLKSPDTIKGKDVFELSEQGDEIAQTHVQNLYESLAEMIAFFQVTYKPEFFAIGGGLSNQKDLLEHLQKEIENFEAKDTPLYNFYRDKFIEEETAPLGKLIVKICHFKNDANLIGAALHFEESK